MNRVIIESPFRGQTLREDVRNINYARRCLLDSINLGESPIASHLLYPQVLNDHKPQERLRGMELGQAWFEVADYLVFYTDYGMSTGMQRALELITITPKLHYYRHIGQNPGEV